MAISQLFAANNYSIFAENFTVSGTFDAGDFVANSLEVDGPSALNGDTVVDASLAVTDALEVDGAVTLGGLDVDDTKTLSVCASSLGALTTKASVETTYVPVWTWGGGGLPLTLSGMCMRSGSWCYVAAQFSITIPITVTSTATITMPFARTSNFSGNPSELTGVVTASFAESISVASIAPTTGAQTATITLKLRSSYASPVDTTITVCFMYNGIAP